MIKEEYLTAQQAAAMLGVQVGTIRKLATRGRIQRAREEEWYGESDSPQGRRPLYVKASVEEYKQKRG